MELGGEVDERERDRLVDVLIEPIACSRSDSALEQRERGLRTGRERVESRIASSAT